MKVLCETKLKVKLLFISEAIFLANKRFLYNTDITDNFLYVSIKLHVTHLVVFIYPNVTLQVDPLRQYIFLLRWSACNATFGYMPTTIMFYKLSYFG